MYVVSAQQYWSNSLEPHKYVTVAEFSERFKKFHVGRAIIDHLATPPPLSEVATKGHSGQDEVLLCLTLQGECLQRSHLCPARLCPQRALPVYNILMEACMC